MYCIVVRLIKNLLKLRLRFVMQNTLSKMLTLLILKKLALVITRAYI